MFNNEHPLLDELNAASNPMICIGQDVFTREDGRDLVKMLEKVSAENNVIREDWNGLNIMLRDSSKAGAYDIGLGRLPDSEVKLRNSKLIWLLGCDRLNVPDIPEDAFVIYQGHHGDEGA